MSQEIVSHNSKWNFVLRADDHYYHIQVETGWLRYWKGVSHLRGDAIDEHGSNTMAAVTVGTPDLPDTVLARIHEDFLGYLMELAL